MNLKSSAVGTTSRSRAGASKVKPSVNVLNLDLNLQYAREIRPRLWLRPPTHLHQAKYKSYLGNLSEAKIEI